jgi:hypothetical protein
LTDKNLYMGTAKREVDLGYLDESQQYLYEVIQSAGFILLFREHSSLMLGKKKGNVDCDIIFHA